MANISNLLDEFYEKGGVVIRLYFSKCVECIINMAKIQRTSRKINYKKLKIALENVRIMVYNKKTPRGTVTCQAKYRGVEQMVARRAHNPEVAGSSPVPATKKSR